MSRRDEPYVTCDGWDDVAILVCEREGCMVGEPETRGPGTTRHRWTMEIDGLTPEQVVAERDRHVAEKHRG